MRAYESTLGTLSCRILDGLDGKAEPDLVVVLCHGFGAPGDDLVPIGPEMARRRPELERRVRFVFPEAPLSLAGLYPGMFASRAWWLLDPERLMAIASGAAERNLDELRASVPEGLAEARDKLLALVAELGVPAGRVVLGGFSQGAMLATDVSLHLPEAPAALCIYSGTLINEADWRERAPARAGLKVLQTHGRQDPLLPHANAEHLRDLLSGAGLDVDFHAFDGQHGLPMDGVDRLAELVAQQLAARDAKTV
jgi:phospholipase/carboxylesterase